MKKALITGGGGLVGSHLALQLLKSTGWEVHSTLRTSTSGAKLSEALRFDGFSIDQLTVHAVDLQDEQQVCELMDAVKPDVVFNAAAIVSLAGVSNDDRLVSANVDMTHFVVEAMLKAENRALLVHVSSIATFGHREDGGLIDETCMVDDIVATSAYTRSKFIAENDVWRASKMGLRVVVVNPSIILGISGAGSEFGGLQDVFRLMARGIPFYTSGVVGYVDVRDVARAMEILALDEKTWGERYCLSSENLSYRSFIGKFANAFGKRAPWFFVPRWLLKIGVWAMGVWSKSRCQKPLLEPFMVGFMTTKSFYDGSKIERVLDTKFSYTPISESTIYIAKRLK